MSVTRRSLAALSAGTRRFAVAVLAAAAVLATVAFAAGLVSELPGTGRSLVAEPDPATQPVVTLDPPLSPSERPSPPQVNLLTEIVPSAATKGVPGRAAATPPEGRYLHLPAVDRYYSLPDDVELIGVIVTGQCVKIDDPDHPSCPRKPLRVYQRGEATIAIDSVGTIFETQPTDDASQFPFFTETK